MVVDVGYNTCNSIHLRVIKSLAPVHKELIGICYINHSTFGWHCNVGKNSLLCSIRYCLEL